MNTFYNKDFVPLLAKLGTNTLIQRPYLRNGNTFDFQRNQQKINWCKPQSFRHGKREDLPLFGTIKIEVFGYGDFEKKLSQTWTHLGDTLLVVRSIFERIM